MVAQDIRIVEAAMRGENHGCCARWCCLRVGRLAKIRSGIENRLKEEKLEYECYLQVVES